MQLPPFREPEAVPGGDQQIAVPQSVPAGQSGCIRRASEVPACIITLPVFCFWFGRLGRAGPSWVLVTCHRLTCAQGSQLCHLPREPGGTLCKSMPWTLALNATGSMKSAVPGSLRQTRQPSPSKPPRRRLTARQWGCPDLTPLPQPLARGWTGAWLPSSRIHRVPRLLAVLRFTSILLTSRRPGLVLVQFLCSRRPREHLGQLFETSPGR